MMGNLSTFATGKQPSADQWLEDSRSLLICQGLCQASMILEPGDDRKTDLGRQ